MEEEFNCAICMEKMEDPVTLCSNLQFVNFCVFIFSNPEYLKTFYSVLCSNFCKGCLDSYFNIRGRISCPLCREKVILSSSKQLNVKKNHYLSKLLEYMKLNEEKFKKQEEENKKLQENFSSVENPSVPVNQVENRGEYLKEASYEEFNEISRLVLDNFEQSGKDKIFQIIIQQVEKFCNPQIARKFFVNREKFRQKLRPIKTVRMLHGTTIPASKSISGEGFRVPTKNVRKDNEPYMFGKAVYFSPMTNKVTKYGKNMIIVADLLLGRIYKTKSFKYKMEKKELENMGYDSIHCLPNTQHSGGVEIEEVALYSTEQILPQYAVTYRLVENKLDDIETYKIEEDYKNEESEMLMKYIDSRSNLIKEFVLTLEGRNISEIEKCVKMIGDLSKYKGCRFRLWYEVSQTPEIYCALRNILLKTKNELVLWESMRAIWGVTYGNEKGQKMMLSYGKPEEGERFLQRVLENFKNHGNRTIKQRSAVLICNFSQLKINKPLIEKFGAVRTLLGILQKEIKESRIDLKLVVNIVGALANLALTYYKKFSNNDKFFIEQMLNNNKLKAINEEIIRLLCNLVFEGKEDEEWMNSENKYVSEKSSEFF